MSISHSVFCRSIALFLSTVLAVQPALTEAAWSQQIIIDPNGNVGTQLQTGRPAPVVDIAPPNTGGVSHNKYQRFNTPDSGGVVLNNSATSSKTTVAGNIAGNRNLTGRSASTIVNEVTSTERSSLKGRLEVAGDRANVIVANPNGLSCDGCNFINTNNATLTTGVPVIDGKNIHLNVGQGTVKIGRRGLNGAATGTSSINLIGRSVVIDGKVTAIDGINVQGGRQSYGWNTAPSGKAPPTASPAGTDYAVDGTAFGAMEAGRIQIVGNEDGLGVRLKGALQSNKTDTAIRAKGRIETNSASAQRNLSIHSDTNDVIIKHDISAITGKAAISARKNATVENRAGVYSGAGTSLNSKLGTVHLKGDLQSDASITVNSQNLNFGAYATARETITFTVSGSASVDGATIVAAKIDGRGFGRDVTLKNSAFFSGTDLAINTNKLSFGKGVIVDGLSNDSNSHLIAQISGDFHNSADMRRHSDAEITWRGNLYNELGGVMSAANLVLDGGKEVHNAGILHGDKQVAIKTTGFINDKSGTIISDAINITSTGDLVNKGTVQSSGKLTLSAAGQLTNDGFVRAKQAWWTGQDITNNGNGDLRIASMLDMTAKSRLVNRGSLNVLGTTTLTANQLSNDGLVISEGGLNAKANQVSNKGSMVSAKHLRQDAGTITNSGVLSSYDRLELTGKTRIANSGSVVADKVLSVSGPIFSNDGEKALVRAKLGKIDTAKIVNSGEIYLIDDFKRVNNIDLFENRGVFASAGSVTIAGRNAKSAIILREGSNLIAGLAPDDKTQTLQARKTVRLDAASISILGRKIGKNNHLATISAAGDVALKTAGYLQIGGRVHSTKGSVTLTGAGIGIAKNSSVYAAGNGALASKSGLKNSGSLVVGKELLLTNGFGQFFNEGVTSAGRLRAATLSGNFVNTGYFGADKIDLIKAPRIENTGHLQSTNNMLLETAGTISLKGTTTAGGDITLKGKDIVLDTVKSVKNPKTKKMTKTGDFFVTANSLQIQADSFTNRGTISLSGSATNNWILNKQLRQEGRIHSKASLTVTTPTILTTQGSLLSSSGVLLIQNAAKGDVKDFDIKGALVGNHVTVKNRATISLGDTAAVTSSGNLRFEASGGLNLRGQMSARNTLVLSGNSLNIAGTVFADKIYGRSASQLANSGNSYAKKMLQLTAEGHMSNSGKISSADKLNLSAGKMFTQGKTGRLEATRISLNAAGKLDNSGKIFGAAQVTLTPGHLNNAFGGLIRSGKINIKTAGSLLNAGKIHAFGVFGNIGTVIDNKGLINGDEIVTLVSAKGTHNLENGQILGRVITLGAAGGFQNKGVIGSTNNKGYAPTEFVRISAAGWASNDKAIQGKNITLTGSGISNNAKALIEAADVLRLDAKQGNIHNDGTLKAAKAAIIAKTRVKNSGKIITRNTLGIHANSNELHNTGTLQGNEITLVAGQAVISDTAISAGKNLLVTGNHAEFKNQIKAGDTLNIKTTSGAVILGSVAAAKTINITAKGQLTARANAIQSSYITQIKAADIQRSDTRVSNEKLRIVPNKVANLYIELTAGNFGPTTTHDKGTAAKLAAKTYEQANISATGNVSIGATAGNLLLTGKIQATGHVKLQSKKLAAFRDVTLKAGKSLHLEGKQYLKNFGKTSISAPNVTLNQKWGWFQTKDWLPERVLYNLTVGAQTIIVNADHRFVDKSVTLRAKDSIWQVDHVISAKGIDYAAGKNIIIEFDPFDWRAANFKGFTPSYSINAVPPANADPYSITTTKDTEEYFRFGFFLKKIKTKKFTAENIDVNKLGWWDPISGGLRGYSLLAQKEGIRLTAGGDIKLRSGKLHSDAGIDITAKGNILSEPIYIKNNKNDRPVNVGWNFDSQYKGPDNGHDRHLVKINELRAYENQIHAKGNINISAIGDVHLIGTRVNSVNGNITLESANGGIAMAAAPGFWSYFYQKTSTKKKYFGAYKKRKTITADRFYDIYKNTVLRAANGNARIATTGKLKNIKVSGASPHNTVLSAGTEITAKNISVKTAQNGQSILLGTYSKTAINETREKTSRKIFWAVPAGSDTTVRKNRVIQHFGNDFLADETLTLKSAGNLEIIGGSLKGRKVSISFAGKLNIRAAINNQFESYYSKRDNMVTITTINAGKNIQTAHLPKITSVTPPAFSVGGKVTIAGYNGPGLNDLLLKTIGSHKFDSRISNIYTPKDSKAAGNLADDVKHSYQYKLPTKGEYAYIKTLLKDHKATYETITLRDQTWYDKQVQLNPAFQAVLTIAVSAATGGTGSGLLAAAQKAAVDSLITSAIGGTITGNFDPEKAIKNALTAGATTYISTSLIKGFGIEGKQIKTNGIQITDLQKQFTPDHILNRAGQKLISHGVDQVALGKSPLKDLDRLGRNFLVSESMAIVQNGIGDLGKGKPKGAKWEGSLPHLLLHGGTGCLAQIGAGGECAAGVMSAVAASMYSGNLNGTTLSDDEQKKRANLYGAAIGYLFSGGDADNVYFASQLATSVIENNRQLHRIEQQWIGENANAFLKWMCDDQKVCGLTRNDAIGILYAETLHGVSDSFLYAGKYGDKARAYIKEKYKGAMTIDNQTMFGEIYGSSEYKNTLLNIENISANNLKYHDIATKWSRGKYLGWSAAPQLLLEGMKDYIDRPDAKHSRAFISWLSSDPDKTREIFKQYGQTKFVREMDGSMAKVYTLDRILQALPEKHRIAAREGFVDGLTGGAALTDEQIDAALLNEKYGSLITAGIEDLAAAGAGGLLAAGFITRKLASGSKVWVAPDGKQFNSSKSAREYQQSLPPKTAPNTANGAFSKVAPATTKQLQKKFKHAADFGVSGNYNPANAKKFNQAIQDHLNAPGTREISGTYRGNPVKFHADPNSGLTVIQNPNGSFLSGWKLNQQQLQHVLKDGKL